MAFCHLTGYGPRLPAAYDELFFYSSDGDDFRLWEKKLLRHLKRENLFSVIEEEVTGFDEKNAQIFDILVMVMEDDYNLKLIRSTEARLDGRAAMKILRAHFCGGDTDTLVSEQIRYKKASDLLVTDVLHYSADESILNASSTALEELAEANCIDYCVQESNFSSARDLLVPDVRHPCDEGLNVDVSTTALEEYEISNEIECVDDENESETSSGVCIESGYHQNLDEVFLLWVADEEIHLDYSSQYQFYEHRKFLELSTLVVSNESVHAGGTYYED